MKIKFNNFKNNDTVLEMELLPAQEKFWNTEKTYSVLNGGFGCIEGETKIKTTEGEISIADLYKNKSAPQVYSLVGKKIRIAQALVPVKYEPAKLYKVSTASNSFIATEKHRVFTSSGWTTVGSLYSGDILVGVSDNFQETIFENKVKSVKYVKTDNYYDLHILGTHNYLAEGFFHHNSGKTQIMLLKVIYDCLSQPDNYFLLGRKTYTEIYDVLLKDFMDLCHPSWIKSFKKTPHPSVELYTQGKPSTIIFRNIDKLAEDEIKGLNLGGFAIDQAEQMPEAVFQGLTFRLRRKNVKHKVYLTCNPALNWLYKKVKADKDTNWELIEASSKENYANLPKETVERYEEYKITDPGYYKQYVLGIWDESLLSENTAFAREHIEKMMKTQREPLRIMEGIEIYKDFVPGHTYQLGVDPAEGIENRDDAAITLVDHTTLEEVAAWSGKLTPEATAEKAVFLAGKYSTDDLKCLIVPEMNSIGYALMNKLKDLGWHRIYQREEIDNKTGRKVNKLGWRTTTSTKPLAISRFRDILRNGNPKVYSQKTIDQFKTFIYSNEAKDKGVGANIGYHDDRIMSLLLGFWSKGKIQPSTVFSPDNSGKERNINKNSFLIIENGVARIRGLTPILQMEKNWTIN
uniref:Putative terminase n=1 Tax=viral metagenome TaxID=1070528 RepID=A0A6H1ZVB2_9ZZZZ